MRSAAKTNISNVYKYFERQASKSKYRGPSQVTRKTAESYWSQVKRHIKDNNRLFTLSAVKDLTHEGFQKVDSSLWKKLVEHVRCEFEDKYWVDDGL